jgi:arginine decarboxylase
MCNGVKDEEYIEIVRQALEDGHKVWISIESVKEARIALERIPKDKLELAFRVKPYTSIISHWGASAGRHSKFGLAIHDILELVEVLKKAKAESTVVAIHGHPGSQVLGNIFSFGEYMARVYTHLRDLGLTQLTVVNMGGGLPINYDNHLDPDVTESYILALVKALKDTIADKHPHPDIMTEGGRCLTALYALLVIRTFDLRHIFPDPLPGEAEQAGQIISNLLEDTADPLAVLAAWRSWQKTRVLYKELPDLLEYERLSGTIKQQLRQKFVHSPNYEAYTKEDVAKDLLRAEHILLGNFSVFNGACDHVLVGQYFPIIPISHLHKQPETIIRLTDITCDSDGEISTYHPPISAKPLTTKDGFPLTTTQKQTWKGFPIGDLSKAPDSYLVIGLVGAYQDIIEMDHNLIGDLPDVGLNLLEDGTWDVQWLGAAQTIQDLVREVGYSLPQLEDPFID